MSYYYNYYCGIKKDGKIFPFGPYDRNNKLCHILSRSSSFASDLHEDFRCVNEDEISGELRDEFESENWRGERAVDVKYLPLEELPKGSFIKRGYFLISDVRAYEEDESDFDGFYDTVSPTVYAAMQDKELKFGPNKPKKDCEGEEYTDPNASDYMYYAYPDWHSKEYEADFIRQFVDEFVDYETKHDAQIVILETEG